MIENYQKLLLEFKKNSYMSFFTHLILNCELTKFSKLIYPKRNKLIYHFLTNIFYGKRKNF